LHSFGSELLMHIKQVVGSPFPYIPTIFAHRVEPRPEDPTSMPLNFGNTSISGVGRLNLF
jgi:hypothetical protein